MGEEEKIAAPDGGAEAPAPGPDMGGIPGGFATAPAGRDVSIKQIYFIIGIVLIVLSMGGGFTGVDALGKEKAQMKEGAIRKSNEYLGPIYPLEEIRTNILSSMISIESKTKNNHNLVDEKDRVLEIKINLVLNHDDVIDEVNKRYPQIIDLLYELIHKRSYEELDSIPDQNKFKRLIKDELNAILSVAKVKEVYFEKFRIMPLQPVRLINLEKNKR